MRAHVLNALRLMEDYPEYHFSASQAQQYAWMKDLYPPLYERIRERVEAGRFEPIGSMWVEADCNIPSGESLVRQIVHGKRFFLDEFGIETTDSLAARRVRVSAALPQILKEAGVASFLTQKMSWNQTNRFPPQPSGGRASTARASSRTSRPPTPTTAT